MGSEHELSKIRLKELTALQQKKFRAIDGLFLAEGILPVEELLKSDYIVKDLVYNPFLEKRQGFSELLLTVLKKGVNPLLVSESVLKKISSEQNPQGVVAVAQKREFAAGLLHGNLLFCDQIQDPGNLGTLFRIAHWFGLGGLILTHGCVEPTNPKVVRASMGSFFHMSYHYVDSPRDLVDYYPNHQLFITSPHTGKSVAEAVLHQPMILAIGNESHGIQAEVYPASEMITLPRLGGAESLNAAVATAALLSRLLI